MYNGRTGEQMLCNMREMHAVAGLAILKRALEERKGGRNMIEMDPTNDACKRDEIEGGRKRWNSKVEYQ